jgi:hypothetical protein
MKGFFGNINKRYEAFQNSISRPKHFVGLILAVGLAIFTIYFKETLEAILSIIYFILFLFSFLWVQFHLTGLKIFKSPLN